MISSRHENADEAHALRRYVAARAAGRTYPEYSRYDAALGCWVASDAAEARGRCDGKAFRQIRRPGLPWCAWLGQDVRIAEDHALQSFFEAYATEGHDWQRLLHEVSRNRHAALRDWRRSGREVIARVSKQAKVGPDVRLPSALAEEFRIAGKGMRSLKKA
ncbi:hypothetical protein C5748_07310 [Phyllobacterium phragmitis]|uniref:Uncharacterized protein n=1 Tax=Phyllobacterium phragmitis TaxID=2670329 RepID=A0A2S9IV11_9HYPH|nr:hypothetical protein [Phyllobacterium phragmitis]PRD44379.1 hypothetical protein C5748_07310 [Phyllobacterium phragmitis]